MNELIGRVYSFEKSVFPARGELFAKLASEGQSPKALMISCADSRIVPEHILQAEPGDLFVCRNAGNIVPPFATMNGGVSSTVEYAVAALGVSDIIVCGHSDCGAMKAVLEPEKVAGLPAVSSWIRHGERARAVVMESAAEGSEQSLLDALTRENVLAQLDNLRTLPCVAAKLKARTLEIHGWMYDIENGAFSNWERTSESWRPLQEATRGAPIHSDAQEVIRD